MKREKFSSRLGFLLISAGCAIGIGNVWRFPYVAGQYGGGLFVLIYLFFLIIIGLPIMTMEFAVGRSSRRSTAKAFHLLEPKGTKWHLFSYMTMIGNYFLMMFYTTVSGWMLYYFFKTAKGDFSGRTVAEISSQFDTMLSKPGLLIFWMIVIVILGFGICSLGLQNGVERITKFMMSSLFIVMIVLIIRSLTLEGSEQGLSFYLLPNMEQINKIGITKIIVAAMGQAFFTLSIGIGSMTIFGSYIGRERRLFGEALNIGILDTLVAFMSGLIIFPACFSFNVNPDSGPKLIFITLPNIFNEMPGGRLWGSLFFMFMTFASLSTVIAVFENIISYGIDLFGWARKKSVLINLFSIIILSLPCALGFNLLSFIRPFGGSSNIQDFEDFIVSNTLLPLGSLIFLLFCTRKLGWGYKNFIEEANTGKGIKFPKQLRFYVTYILPVLIIILFLQGYAAKFFH